MDLPTKFKSTIKSELLELENRVLLLAILRHYSLLYRSSHRRCSLKKVFLKISRNSQENTCARVSFLIKLHTFGLRLKACKFIKKETLAQVFSCEFCENFKNSAIFIEHLRWLLLTIACQLFWIFLLFFFAFPDFFWTFPDFTFFLAYLNC